MFWAYLWGGIAIVYCVWIIAITKYPSTNQNLRFLSLIGGLSFIFLLAITANNIHHRSNPRWIIFAGKVVNDKTGEWPNDRLILAYLKGKEVGRDLSKTSEFIRSLGVLDGGFAIPISNTYQLRLREDTFKIAKDKITTGYISNNAYNGIYIWLEVAEGSQVEINVPAKNLTYIIKSIAGDKSSLPPQLLVAGSTHLNKDNQILVAFSEDETGQPQNILPQSIPNIENIRYNTERETIPMSDVRTEHLNNCGGSGVLRRDLSYIKSIIHEYQIEVSGQAGVEIPVPIPIIQPKLFAALQAKYGFEQGEIETKIEEYHLEAEPGTNQEYVITAKEVWESGAAQVIIDTDVITIPFRVRTDLIYDVASQKLNCN